jgi:hypothetical protein
MMNEVKILFIDNIPYIGVSEFEVILRERGHRPTAVAFFAPDERRIRARVEFATPRECKAARFDLGGLVVEAHGQEYRLFAAPFREGSRRVMLGDEKLSRL